jgi:hypothetical protein
MALHDADSATGRFPDHKEAARARTTPYTNDNR